MIEKRTLLPHTITPGLFTTILDSGATSHLIKDRGYFIDFVKEDCPPVKTANQGMLRTSGCGSCVVEIALGKDTYCLVLKECLHAPGALLNLLSVGHMLNQPVAEADCSATLSFMQMLVSSPLWSPSISFISLFLPQFSWSLQFTPLPAIIAERFGAQILL